MSELVTSSITFLCFVVAPSVLLGREYNFAVGFGYFCALSGLISIYFSSAEIKRELVLINARLSDWRMDWRTERDAFGPIPKGAPADAE